MKLVWTAAAASDRTLIFDYIEARNPAAALDLDDRFTEAAAALSRSPMIGRPGRVEGTREFVAHRRYLLVYAIKEDRIVVLSVLHTSRRWPP